jgi:hypothetical protein
MRFPIILLFLLLALNLHAQKPKWEIGLSTGATINNVYSHINEAKFDWRISPRLYSAFARFTKNDIIGFELELDYVEKGPKNFQISYITVAPLMNIIFPHNRVSFSVGPYFARLNKYIEEGEIKNYNFITNYDIGLQVDFQKEFNIGNLHAFVSPQVEWGFTRFSLSRHIIAQLKFGVIINTKSFPKTSKKVIQSHS